MADWLEDYLKKFKGALLMITHDRYFLDSVTNRIVELDNGKLYSYQANYEGFLELKAERVDMEKGIRAQAPVHFTDRACLDAARRESPFHEAERPDPAFRGTAGQKGTGGGWKSRDGVHLQPLGGLPLRFRISANA